MLLIAQEKHQCTQLIAEPESQPLKCSELFVFGKNWLFISNKTYSSMDSWGTCETKKIVCTLKFLSHSLVL